MEDFARLARTYVSQMMEMGERFVLLEKSARKASGIGTLEDEVMSCKKCLLHNSKKNYVFGEGNPRADLMFVGEAPGREEDLKGRPFVGAAGELLTKMIGAMGLKRSDVYIANVLKCRPPGNRDPLRSEVDACRGYLLRQIELVRPKVICGLGSHASKTLLDTTSPISSLRGKSHRLGSATFVPTYHPAALLRNPGWKRPAWDDLKQVLRLLDLEPKGD
jgi:DNA polymerase